MSTSISFMGYAGEQSPEFIKHREVVFFCIEKGVSYPKETSEFFKGKIQGSDLEDFTDASLVEYLQFGIEIPIKVFQSGFNYEIDLKSLPKEVDKIIVKWS